MKLSEAILEYDLHLKTKAKSTRDLNLGTLHKLLAFVGDFELCSVTISQLRRWRESVDSEPISVYTFHRHVRQAKRFFSWCVGEGLLEKSPAVRLEMPKLPKNKPPRAISMEDLKRIVDAAKATGLREYAFVRFLAETGCRLGGILHLKLEDMDLDLGWAVVSEKGEKTRNVFCSPETAEALRAWLAIRPDNKGNVVFVGERGSLTKSGVRSMLNRLSEKAGVTGRHNAHSFRHALARRLLFNGADMGTVSRLLGHSNIETTHDFYAIWTERELWLRYRQFGGLI